MKRIFNYSPSGARLTGKIMRKAEYKNFSWTPEDLLSSKNAVNCMLIEGVSEEEILSLDFGNLDVAAVIEEYYQ